MSSLTKNKINGGYRGDLQNPPEKAFVYFDGSDIFEIDKNVAKGFSQSPIHSFIKIKNMWMDKSEEKYIKDSFKNISKEAFSSILSTNIRGIEVEMYYIHEENKKYYENCLYVFECVENLPDKDYREVVKIIKKYENSNKIDD